MEKHKTGKSSAIPKRPDFFGVSLSALTKRKTLKTRIAGIPAVLAHILLSIDELSSRLGTSLDPRVFECEFVTKRPDVSRLMEDLLDSPLTDVDFTSYSALAGWGVLWRFWFELPSPVITVPDARRIHKRCDVAKVSTAVDARPHLVELFADVPSLEVACVFAFTSLIRKHISNVESLHNAIMSLSKLFLKDQGALSLLLTRCIITDLASVIPPSLLPVAYLDSCPFEPCSRFLATEAQSSSSASLLLSTLQVATAEDCGTLSDAGQGKKLVEQVEQTVSDTKTAMERADAAFETVKIRQQARKLSRRQDVTPSQAVAGVSCRSSSTSHRTPPSARVVTPRSHAIRTSSSPVIQSTKHANPAPMTPTTRATSAMKKTARVRTRKFKSKSPSRSADVPMIHKAVGDNPALSAQQPKDTHLLDDVVLPLVTAAVSTSDANETQDKGDSASSDRVLHDDPNDSLVSSDSDSTSVQRAVAASCTNQPAVSSNLDNSSITIDGDLDQSPAMMLEMSSFAVSPLLESTLSDGQRGADLTANAEPAENSPASPLQLPKSKTIRKRKRALSVGERLYRAGMDAKEKFDERVAMIRSQQEASEIAEIARCKFQPEISEYARLLPPEFSTVVSMRNIKRKAAIEQELQNKDSVHMTFAPRLPSNTDALALRARSRSSSRCNLRMDGTPLTVDQFRKQLDSDASSVRQRSSSARSLLSREERDALINRLVNSKRVQEEALQTIRSSAPTSPCTSVSVCKLSAEKAVDARDKRRRRIAQTPPPKRADSVVGGHSVRDLVCRRFTADDTVIHVEDGHGADGADPVSPIAASGLSLHELLYHESRAIEAERAETERRVLEAARLNSTVKITDPRTESLAEQRRRRLWLTVWSSHMHPKRTVLRSGRLSQVLDVREVAVEKMPSDLRRDIECLLSTVMGPAAAAGGDESYQLTSDQFISLMENILAKSMSGPRGYLSEASIELRRKEQASTLPSAKRRAQTPTALPQALVERLYAKEQARQAKINAKRRDEDDKRMAQCTFHPKIGRPRSSSHATASVMTAVDSPSVGNERHVSDVTSHNSLSKCQSMEVQECAKLVQSPDFVDLGKENRAVPLVQPTDTIQPDADVGLVLTLSEITSSPDAEPAFDYASDHFPNKVEAVTNATYAVSSRRLSGRSRTLSDDRSRVLAPSVHNVSSNSGYSSRPQPAQWLCARTVEK